MNIQRLLTISIILVSLSGSPLHSETDKKILKSLLKTYSEVEYIPHSDCYRVKSKDKNKTSGICGSDGKLIVEPIYKRIVFEQGYNGEALAIALNPIVTTMGEKDNKIFSISRGVEIFNSGSNEPQIIEGGFLSGYMMPIFDYNSKVVLNCQQTSVMPIRNNTEIIGYRVNHREIVNKEPKDELWICDENFNRLFFLEGAGYLWKIDKTKDENGVLFWLCTQNNAFGITETKRFSANGTPLDITETKSIKSDNLLSAQPVIGTTKQIGDTQELPNNLTANNFKQTEDKTISITKETEPLSKIKDKADNKKGSDVDFNIPQSNLIADNTFAVIICNQDYVDVAEVDFAINDGETFAQYCKHTLGIPESHIRLLKNATLNQMKRQIHWLSQISEAYGESAKFVVYYSGHGIPDESTHDAYLLPVDGFPGDLSTGYKVEQLYSQLSEMKANQIILLMDACFSGTKRNNDMIVAARGVALRPKANSPKGNMIVLSAAQGNETAHSFQDKRHGMFTYFLLKKIKESSPELTLGELSDYVITEVKKASLVHNNKIQTPSISVSPLLKDTWRNSSF